MLVTTHTHTHTPVLGHLHGIFPFSFKNYILKGKKTYIWYLYLISFHLIMSRDLLSLKSSSLPILHSQVHISGPHNQDTFFHLFIAFILTLT